MLFYFAEQAVSGMKSAENIVNDSVWPNQKLLSEESLFFSEILQNAETAHWINLVCLKPRDQSITYSCPILLQAVLETIRNLMNTDCVVPDWLHDIILGYGDPSSAHYSKMPNQIASLDFNDTFLSIDHLKASFPGYNITVTTDNRALQIPPFRWLPNLKSDVCCSVIECPAVYSDLLLYHSYSS